MKIISSGVSRIVRLLGTQHIQTDGTKYRRMNYLLQSECPEGVLLHNVITGCLVLLDEEEAKAIDSLPQPANKTIAGLIERYFLVPEDYNEWATVNTLRALSRRLFAPKGISSFTILTTTNCNARCFYCYQKDCSKVDMDVETADKVVDYISANKSTDMVKLGWFGGEPLLNSGSIDRICSGLRSKGIGFESAMTSNGFLFNDELIQKATGLWNLRHIQITLDGTENTYNRVKAYVERDTNPFEHVLGNISKLLQAGIRVSVRLNFDWYNIPEIEELCRLLKDRFENFSGLTVYPHFLLQRDGKSLNPRTQDEEDVLIEEQIRLKRLITDWGLKESKPALPYMLSRSCGADDSSSIVIYPDGRLYKCIDVSERDDQVGTIDSKELDQRILNQYHEKIELDRCVNCPLYPFCIISVKCPDTGKRNRVNCNFRVRSGAKEIAEWAKKKGTGQSA